MPSNRDNQQTSKQLPRLPGVDDLAIIPARKPAMAAAAVTGSGDALIVPTEDTGVDEPSVVSIASASDPYLGKTFGV